MSVLTSQNKRPAQTVAGCSRVDHAVLTVARRLTVGSFVTFISIGLPTLAAGHAAAVRENLEILKLLMGQSILWICIAVMVLCFALTVAKEVAPNRGSRLDRWIALVRDEVPNQILLIGSLAIGLMLTGVANEIITASAARVVGVLMLLGLTFIAAAVAGFVVVWIFSPPIDAAG